MEYTKASVLAEINEVLDNEILTSEQLLGELLGAMTDVELKENWDYIKRMWLNCFNIDLGDEDAE